MILLVGFSAAALLAAGLIRRWIGNMFLDNLRKRQPDEPFNTGIDIRFYQKGPMPGLTKAGRAYLETLEKEELMLVAEDGTRLHGMLFLPPDGEKQFVIGIHGFHSDPVSEYGPHIAYYRSIGWGMLLVDDRAHGLSEGAYATMGVKDARDTVNWAQYMAARFGREVRLLLHGVSMGGASVLAAAGEADLPREVIGVVSDCAFSSAAEMFSVQIRRMYPIPTELPIRICGRYAKKKAGFDLNERRPVDQVKRATVPIFFVHGAEDSIVPPSMAKTLYDACTAPKSLLMVPKANHGESIGVDPEGYHKGIEALIRQAV